jgi:hypothetical protein
MTVFGPKDDLRLRDRDLGAGPLAVTAIGDGHSTLTDLVTDGVMR